MIPNAEEIKKQKEEGRGTMLRSDENLPVFTIQKFGLTEAEFLRCQQKIFTDFHVFM